MIGGRGNRKYTKYINNISIEHRSEGFAFTGYDIPGCVQDGAWRLWENSSVAVVAAVLAHPVLGEGRRDFSFSRNQITKMRPQAHFCDLMS